MKWFRIPKEITIPPTTGKHYRDWKEHLAKEGKEQCVYCTINIKSFGGIRNFHVEHYKPKAENKFPELIHDINNLYFACSICNTFKSDEWPNEPNELLDNLSFPNPSKIDYSDFLYLNDKFIIESDKKSGKYIIQQLFLNRPQLILERKYFNLHMKLKYECERLIGILSLLKTQGEDNPILNGYIKSVETSIFLIDEQYINPYTTKQTQR